MFRRIPVSVGKHLMGVDGVELRSQEDPYQALDRTAGRDPQLDRGVDEALELLEAAGGTRAVTPPPFPRRARRPKGR